MAKPKLTYCSKVECARQLGITPRSLDNWSKEDGFPRSARKGDRLWCPDKVQEWRKRTAEPDQSSAGSAGPRKGRSGDQMELYESLRLELLEGRARSMTAKSVMDVADAGRELGLLLPRVAFESALSELFSGVRDLCEDLPDRVKHIEGLDDQQRARVREFLATVLASWQNRTADRIETVLSDLGPVPELLDLAAMSQNTEAATEDSDG